MSIANYDELKIAVANWVDRADLTSKVPDFIMLGEARINRHLRVRQMEHRSQMSTIADTEYYGLPPGWLKGRTLKIIKAYGSQDKDLEYTTPENMDVIGVRKFSGGAALPVYYTVSGNELRFMPKPDAIYTIETIYYKKAASLGTVTTTNAILEDFPDIYLYASILEAAIYLKDERAAKSYGTLFGSAIDAATKADAEDRHSGGALHVVGEQIGA